MDYRRIWHPGGTYFFTINLQQRVGNDLLVRHADTLRSIITQVRNLHPFRIHAWVVLPDHMHCIIELPEGDTDFALRIRLIKMLFSKAVPVTEQRSAVHMRRKERGVWQRRYWEHLIRDEADYRAHMDYVHINPLKHGLVARVADWPHSTFHRWVRRGVYPNDWGTGDCNMALYDD